jgi:peptidyl-prolyl cis-trans isomerase SurA
VRQLVDRTVRTRVSVEEREIEAYWEEHRAEIPLVPALLHLRRIVVGLGGAAGADSAAIERANIVRGRIDDGDDFGTLARVFSEGPSASRGGDLGWFHPDDLEPVLGDAVRDAADGHVTPVLVTSRGAHILRVSGVRENGERRLSQIVFLRDEEAARTGARARAESIRDRLLRGEDFERIARAESDEPAGRESGGDLGAVPLEALDARYRDALKDLAAGGISRVIEAEDAFVILRLDGREGEREPTFEEMRDRIAAVLEQEKGKTYYDKLLETARNSTYVELRL